MAPHCAWPKAPPMLEMLKSGQDPMQSFLARAPSAIWMHLDNPVEPYKPETSMQVAPSNSPQTRNVSVIWPTCKTSIIGSPGIRSSDLNTSLQRQ